MPVAINSPSQFISESNSSTSADNGGLIAGSANDAFSQLLQHASAKMGTKESAGSGALTDKKASVHASKGHEKTNAVADETANPPQAPSDALSQLLLSADDGSISTLAAVLDEQALNAAAAMAASQDAAIVSAANIAADVMPLAFVGAAAAAVVADPFVTSTSINSATQTSSTTVSAAEGAEGLSNIRRQPVDPAGRLPAREVNPPFVGSPDRQLNGLRTGELPGSVVDAVSNDRAVNATIAKPAGTPGDVLGGALGARAARASTSPLVGPSTGPIDGVMRRPISGVLGEEARNTLSSRNALGGSADALLADPVTSPPVALSSAIGDAVPRPVDALSAGTVISRIGARPVDVSSDQPNQPTGARLSGGVAGTIVSGQSGAEVNGDVGTRLPSLPDADAVTATGYRAVGKASEGTMAESGETPLPRADAQPNGLRGTQNLMPQLPTGATLPGAPGMPNVASTSGGQALAGAAKQRNDALREDIGTGASVSSRTSAASHQTPIGQAALEAAINSDKKSETSIASSAPDFPMSAASSLVSARQDLATDAVTARIEAPVNSAVWQHEVAQKMAQLVAAGNSRAEFHLEPANMGPVDIQINMAADQPSLLITAAHPATRDALEQALPHLREMLASQGISLGQTTVQGEQPRHQQTAEQTTRSTFDQPADNRTALAGAAGVDTPSRKADRLVDVFA